MLSIATHEIQQEDFSKSTTSISITSMKQRRGRINIQLKEVKEVFTER